MLGKLKNSLRRTHNDIPKDQPQQQQPTTTGGIYANPAQNESSTSVASVASIKPRNIFRRSKMPTEFTLITSTSQSQSQPRVSESSTATSSSSSSSRNENVAPAPTPFLDSVAEASPSPSPLASRFETPPSTKLHAKTNSGSGSVRSILRDRMTPGTGRSVRWNGLNSTRIITPDHSAASTSVSIEAGSSEETVQTNLLSKLEASTDEEDSFPPLPPSRAGTPSSGRAQIIDFPALLDEDPFASHTPPPSQAHHRRSASSASVSTVLSSMELEEPPSAATNLLEVSDELPSASMSDSLASSFDKATLLLDEFPQPGGLGSPQFSERPTSEAFNFQTPRQSMFDAVDASPSNSSPFDSFAPQTPSASVGQQLFPQTPSPPKPDSAPPSAMRPHAISHSRMPSEAPTIRPSPGHGRQSPLKVDLSADLERSLSPLPSTPDASVYHTPGHASFSREEDGQEQEQVDASRDQSYEQEHSQSGMFYSFAPDPSSPAPFIPPSSSHHTTSGSMSSNYMTPFLLPYEKDEEEPRGTEVLNPAFTVPNNSLTFPASLDASTSKPGSQLPTSTSSNPEYSSLLFALQQKLSLYESLHESYESDLSARDSLVEELSLRIDKADEECAAWRSEAERTARRFERMRGKVVKLSEACEELGRRKEMDGVFERASEGAMRELRHRLHSLEAEREAERREKEKERQELEYALAKARRDAEGWEERAREYERSGEALIEQLNSFGGDASFTSSLMRPPSVQVVSIADVVRAASSRSRPQSGAEVDAEGLEELVTSPTVVEGRFNPPARLPSMSDFDSLHLPSTSSNDDEPVYVLKSEILKREREFVELSERLARAEPKSSSTPSSSRPSSTAASSNADPEENAKIAAQLMHAQSLILTANAKLTSQTELVGRLQEEITCLEEEKAAALNDRNDVGEELERTKGREEILTRELEDALARVREVEGERDEALMNLDGERGDLETANEELHLAHEQLTELNAHLDDQRQRLDSAQHQILELEGQLSKLSGYDDDILAQERQGMRMEVERERREWEKERMDLSSHVEWLRNTSGMLEEKLQDAHEARDSLTRQLNEERQSIDELALAHSSLQRETASLEESLRSSRQTESELTSRVAKLESLLSQASDAVSERERQCLALETLHSDTQSSLDLLRAQHASTSSELDSLLRTKGDEAARAGELERQLAEANERIKEVKRLNADLEMRNLQLAKAVKKSEEDTAGLYMGLEAKQQELELIKRKFGVRGTAGATPATSGSIRAKMTDSGFKVPQSQAQARRSSISSTADTDDGKLGAVASRLQSKGVLRPRVSVATPTPATNLSRHPSLTTHARKMSSSSTLSSAAGAAGVPVRPPGLRRPESMSDAESVSAPPTTATKRSLAPAKSATSTSTSTAPTSFRRSPSAELSSSRIGSHRRTPSTSLRSTPEEKTTVDKENLPALSSADEMTTPKASAVARRRIMIPA